LGSPDAYAKMNVTLQFSIVMLIISLFSLDPDTSLIADRFCKPNYKDFIVFEDNKKNKKDRDNNNYNEDVKKKILLVDDEPDLTFSIKKGLEHVGFDVDIFNDSMHVLGNFKPNFYDLVILDIVMPKMNGFDLYKELKKLDPRINACFLTASEQYHEDQREVKYRDFGQDLFIQKPISLEDMKRQIKERLGPTNNSIDELN
jgi:CheY-like chemotaxis protein